MYEVKLLKTVGDGNIHVIIVDELCDCDDTFALYIGHCPDVISEMEYRFLPKFHSVFEAAAAGQRYHESKAWMPCI